MATYVPATATTPLNVHAFGAVGDGLHDDTAAIQAACNTGLPIVALPPGLYRVTGSITPQANQRLQGASRASTVILASGSADAYSPAVITVTTPFVSVQDLAIDCAGIPNLSGISVQRAGQPSQFRLRDVTVYGLALGSPYSNSGLYLSGYDNHVHGFESDGPAVWGVQVNGASDCTFTNIVVVQAANGLSIYGSEHLFLTNIDCDSCTGSSVVTIDTSHHCLLVNCNIWYNGTQYSLPGGPQTGLQIGTTGSYSGSNLPSNIQVSNLLVNNLGDGSTNSAACALYAGDGIRVEAIASNTNPSYTTGGTIGAVFAFGGSNPLSGTATCTAYGVTTGAMGIAPDTFQWRTTGAPPAPSTTTLTAGTIYQNTTGAPLAVYIPVWASTAGTAGAITVQCGPSTPPGTLFTDIVNANTTSTVPRTVILRVPNGWYYAITATGATLGTATLVMDG
jgi:hypothetical protein